MSKIGVTCHVSGKGRVGEETSLWVHRREDGTVTIALGPAQEQSVQVSVDDVLEAVALCGGVNLTWEGEE